MRNRLSAEEGLRFLADAMPQMVWTTRPDGHPEYFNRQWYAYTGAAPGDTDGWGWASLLHPDDYERTLQRWTQSLETGEPYEIEYRLRRHDGVYRWQLGRALPRRDSQGRVVQWVGTCTDIHDQKTAEAMQERLVQVLDAERARLRQLNETLEERVETRTAELTRANLQLEEMNRALRQSNRELQDFAYVASHDLQEPLRKIQAFADLLRTEYETHLDEEGRHFLKRMQNAAGRMSRLISDLLAFSRVRTKAQPFELVDLNEVLQDVLFNLEIRLEETGGRVEASALPAVTADPTQMRQLLQNLVGNALKFHRQGIPPVVRVHATHEETSAGTPARWRLEITDNGIGFDEKYLDRIFSPFQRLHGRNTYAGTGMGLAICRRIAERHGGTITAVSTPGQGSTFLVTLPVQQPPRPARSTIDSGSQTAAQEAMG